MRWHRGTVIARLDYNRPQGQSGCACTLGHRAHASQSVAARLGSLAGFSRHGSAE